MTCRAVLGDLHVILHDVAFDSKVSWLTALLKKQTQLHVIAAAVDSLHTVCMYACVLIHVTRLQQGFTYTLCIHMQVCPTLGSMLVMYINLLFSTSYTNGDICACMVPYPAD